MRPPPLPSPPSPSPSLFQFSQCNFIFFAIVSGGIFFGEFNDFDATQWVGFSCGVAVMFAGLGLLTPTPDGDMGASIQRNLSRGEAGKLDSDDEEGKTDEDFPEYTHPKPSIMELGNQLAPVPAELVHRLSNVPHQVGGIIKEFEKYASEYASERNTSRSSADGRIDVPPAAVTPAAKARPSSGDEGFLEN